MPFPSSTTYPGPLTFPGGGPGTQIGGYLPGPVNTLTDFQVEFNGFLLGNGTPYEIPPTSDFLDMAAIKTMDQARVWADGSWSGPDFADVLLPALTVEISDTTPTAFQADVIAFRNAFAPQTVPFGLWVKLPGMAPFGIPAKVNKRSMPIGLEWNGGFITAALQFRCPDPAWQSAPRTTQLAAGSPQSGMTFPLFAAVPGVLDFGTTGISSSAGTLTNAGNTPAWPVAVVAGPCPGFTVIVDGSPVTYTDIIPAGQSVTVDYRAGTATLTGNVDRTNKLSSRQFTAVTSISSVFFSAATGTAAITVADIWR
jgi:hypothetical protein